MTISAPEVSPDFAGWAIDVVWVGFGVAALAEGEEAPGCHWALVGRWWM